MIAVGSDDNNPSGGGKCQVFEYNDSTRWVFMNQKEKKHTVKSCISLCPIFRLQGCFFLLICRHEILWMNKFL